MANKVKDILTQAFEKDRRIKWFVAIGIIGLILILLSEYVPQTADNKAVKSDNVAQYAAYTQTLEKKTTELISSVEGVGRCSVMITLKETNESVYAKNHEENTSDGSYSKKYEYVLYDEQSGDSPLLIKQYFPEIKGVAVVCDGADNTVVREQITESISALFDVPVTKISVSKYKG